MKKRIAIGSAIAVLMTVFAGTVLRQDETYGQCRADSNSAIAKASITDRWQITTQVLESNPIETTAVQEKEHAETTIRDVPKRRDASVSDTPYETTAYIETKPLITLEITASSEEAKQQTASNESFTPSEQTTQPPKPSQPQHGDINEKGVMYINGFGWIAFEGTNSCEYSTEMYTNGNKIGYFG